MLDHLETLQSFNLQPDHCWFGLCYIIALVSEMIRSRWQHAGLRILGLSWGFLGLVIHSIYLANRYPTPAGAHGSLLVLAWVLAVFGLYESLHRSRQAWAVFVWPVVVILVTLAGFFFKQQTPVDLPTWLVSDRLWATIHGILLLLAAIGVCVGFLASCMYIVQAHRIRTKAQPLSQMKLLSLERLESMNRRSVNLAFPMLTLGLLLGLLLIEQEYKLSHNWMSVKILGTVGLWIVCLLLCYLRYVTSVPARRLAVLTILAFVLMVLTLIAAHPFAGVDRNAITAAVIASPIGRSS